MKFRPLEPYEADRVSGDPGTKKYGRIAAGLYLSEKQEIILFHSPDVLFYDPQKKQLTDAAKALFNTARSVMQELHEARTARTEEYCNAALVATPEIKAMPLFRKQRYVPDEIVKMDTGTYTIYACTEFDGDKTRYHCAIYDNPPAILD